MRIFRFSAFVCIFFINTAVQMAVSLPFYFFLPRKMAWAVPRLWIKSSYWLLKHIVGIDYVIEGVENIPKGSCIISSKHQSSLDAVLPLLHFDDPVLILKRELTYIPLFGWYMAKVGIIALNRGAPLKAMKALVAGAHKKVKDGRQILIFPEGTRHPPGATPDYKPGIAALYGELKVPVVMIAHNAGLYWPRERRGCYPGTIRVQILPPIPPGLSRKDFMARLIKETEEACDTLLFQALGEKNPPPLPPTAMARLQELRIANKEQDC